MGHAVFNPHAGYYPCPPLAGVLLPLIAPAVWKAKVLCGRYIFAENSLDLLTNVFSVDDYGEMQTIELQKYWMEAIGYVAVDLSEFQWYDSGNPLSWLKAQIDYGLRNLDYSAELKTWLTDRLK